MPSRKRGYLSDFVSKQYPIDDYKKLIIISLDIVENFLIAIEGQYQLMTMREDMELLLIEILALKLKVY